MGVYGELMSSTEEIVSKLELLDVYCGLHQTKGQLLMFGGSAILIALELQNYEFRPTRDIDVGILQSTNESALIQAIQEANVDLILGTIEVPPKEDFSALKKHRLNINTLEYIEVFVPSSELLACTKLFSKRQKDLDDLENTDLVNVCDKDELVKLIRDYKQYILNPEHPDWNYHKIDDIFELRGI